MIDIASFLLLKMRAKLNNVTDYSLKVLIENIKKIPLLCHVEEELVVLNIVALERLIRVEVLRNFVNTFLQRRECFVTNFSQV